MTVRTILVTGAAGFLGSALVRRLSARPGDRLVLLDRALPEVPPGAVSLEGDIADPAVIDRALQTSPDVVFHLASIPSGAAEMDPGLSARVNLYPTLRLFERLAARERPARVVYASSIAALGSRFAGLVDDDLTPRPTLTYGAHKLMAETALADWSRRGRISGVALRPPGILARPSSVTAGFGSAFWSEVFHAVIEGRTYDCPAGPDAVGWLMSVRRCVEDFVAAGDLAEASMGDRRAMTLPALAVRLGDLVTQIALQTGGRAEAVRYRPDPEIVRQFGSYPALATPAADSLGLSHDGDVAGLVSNVLADLEHGAAVGRQAMRG